MFKEISQIPVISGSQITRIYVPAVQGKFNPTEFFFDSHRDKYSLMRTFVNQVLIDTEVASNLPSMELLSTYTPQGTLDKEILDQCEIKEGKIMTPIEACQAIAYVTKKEWGKYSVDSDGTIVLIGYVVCHDKQIRPVTIYREGRSEQWIINCHELSEWAPKIKLLVKEISLTKTKGREN